MKLRTRKERAEFASGLAGLALSAVVPLVILGLIFSAGRSSVSAPSAPSTGNGFADFFAQFDYALVAVFLNPWAMGVVASVLLYAAAWWLWVQAGDEDPETPIGAQGASA